MGCVVFDNEKFFYWRSESSHYYVALFHDNHACLLLPLYLAVIAVTLYRQPIKTSYKTIHTFILHYLSFQLNISQHNKKALSPLNRSINHVTISSQLNTLFLGFHPKRPYVLWLISLERLVILHHSVSLTCDF